MVGGRVIIAIGLFALLVLSAGCYHAPARGAKRTHRHVPSVAVQPAVAPLPMPEVELPRVITEGKGDPAKVKRAAGE